jgi:predicted transcriptional regulator
MNGTGAAGTEEAGELSASEVHDVLRNNRRRLVLERLRTTRDAETVSDLAEHIGGIEAGESPPPRNVRQSVYVSLHQTHLPKLDELGIVDYDPDGKTVELAANADDLQAYLDAGSGDDGIPPAYYAGLGLLGGAVLLGAVAGVPGLRAAGPAAVGLGLSAALVATAVYDFRARGGSVGFGTD